MFAVSNPKKHSIKCSLISSKGMCGWPLYIQKTEWCVNPDMWSPSKCFPLLPPLLYHCLESYRKKNLLSQKALWVWSGGLSPLQTMPYKILFKFISALPFLPGDNTTNHWPTDTQLEVMRQLRLQATLFNSLSLTLHHWINIKPPMRVRHWGGVKRELGKILSHT